MATARSARVIGALQVSADTRIVELEAADPLQFVGGQYVIIDSGRVAPTGKAIKRAYSLLSTDAEQQRFQLAVKQLGACSSFVHELDAGTEVKFSGPWGKFFPAADAGGATLVLSTDTGVSAALGMVQSVRFAPLLPRAVFVWLRTSPDYFLPDTHVRARVPAACGEVRIEDFPAIGDPARIPLARARLADVLGQTPLAQAFIAGDGAVNYALLDDLIAAGVPATRDHVESFFNMPKKSA
jgi:ferredoxin-NADP reductase